MHNRNGSSTHVSKIRHSGASSPVLDTRADGSPKNRRICPPVFGFSPSLMDTFSNTLKHGQLANPAFFDRLARKLSFRLAPE